MRCGYGFHYWAVPSHDLDRNLADYRARGYETAFTDISLRGARIAYVDTTRDLLGTVALIEMSERLEGDLYPGVPGVGRLGRNRPVRRAG